jgi:hypothetical protein
MGADAMPSLGRNYVRHGRRRYEHVLTFWNTVGPSSKSNVAKKWSFFVATGTFAQALATAFHAGSNSLNMKIRNWTCVVRVSRA